MKILIISASILMLLSFTSIDAEQAIDDSKTTNSEEGTKYILDSVMVKYLDLSNRDEKEIVKYHLKVKDWSQPVEWSFIILSGNDTLLIKYSDETQIDKFFNDILYLGNCSGYLDCKMRWYLNSIMDFKVESFNPNDSKISLFRKVSKNFVKTFGKNKEEADQNYRSFWEYYSDKEMKAIYFRLAPEGRSTPLLVFHPELNILVPIYSP